MKKVIAIVLSVIFIFAFATLTIAAEEKKAAAPAEKKEAAPAKGKKGTVTGEVMAIDAKANTLTVKGPKKGDVAVTVTDKTKITAGKDAKTMADIKAGDKVKVAYTEAEGKNTANSINIEASAPKKEEKKAAAPAAPAPAPKAEEKKAPAAPAKKSASGY